MILNHSQTGMDPPWGAMRGETRQKDTLFCGGVRCLGWGMSSIKKGSRVLTVNVGDMVVH